MKVQSLLCHIIMWSVQILYFLNFLMLCEYLFHHISFSIELLWRNINRHWSRGLLCPCVYCYIKIQMCVYIYIYVCIYIYINMYVLHFFFTSKNLGEDESLTRAADTILLNHTQNSKAHILSLPSGMAQQFVHPDTIWADEIKGASLSHLIQ